MSGKYEIDENEIVFSDANRYENLLPPRQGGGSGDIPAHSIGKDKLTNELASELDGKTKKHILNYESNKITENGTTLTYTEIYDLLMNTPDFIVLVSANKAYHPNIVNTQEIAFISTYPNGGYNETDRIVIKSNNTVSKSLIANEKKDNKVSAITASNISSGTNYPSNKAITGYLTANYASITNRKVLTFNENWSFAFMEQGAGLVSFIIPGFIPSNISGTLTAKVLVSGSWMDCGTVGLVVSPAGYIRVEIAQSISALENGKNYLLALTGEITLEV